MYAETQNLSLKRQWREQIGREADVVQFAMNNRFARPDGTHNIKSIFHVTKSRGRIYVETDCVEDVQNALKGCIHVFPLRDTIQTMHATEIPQLLSPVREKNLTKHSWVRIRGGLYHNDVGQVRNVYDVDNKVEVAVVPRLAPAARTKPSKRLRTQEQRPTPRRLKEEDARKQYGDTLVTFLENGFQIKEKIFEEAGFHVASFDRKALEVIKPKIHEISNFTDVAMERLISEGVDITKCTDMQIWRVAHINADGIEYDCFVEKGDTVRIIEGPNKGVTGRVSARVRKDAIKISLVVENDKEVTTVQLEENVQFVRAIFQKGDLVEIRTGVHVGKTGFIVDEIGTHLVIRDLRNIEEVRLNHAFHRHVTG